MADFTFKDIVALGEYGLWSVLEKTDFYTLIDALKTADAQVRDKFFKIMSKKTAAKAQTALENSSLNLEESEKAQQEIIFTIGDICKHTYFYIDGDFTFPNSPCSNTKNKVSDIIDSIEIECEREGGSLYFDSETTEDELRKAFEAFQDRRDELARIRSLNVRGRLLAVIVDFLEMDKIEDLDVHYCDSVSQLPFWDNLSALKKLRITDSKLIPENIGKLQSLTNLTLYSNRMLEVLPESIGSLTNLKNFDIYGSPLLNHLPKSFDNLQSLTDLSLDWRHDINALSVISSLKNLRNLKICDASSVEIFDWIGKLQSLEKFELHDCYNISILPECIGDLKNLNDLSLCSLPSLTRLPESIGNLQSLTKFYLNGCENIKALPESIGNLKNLNELTLYNLPSLTRLPDSIGGLQSLKKLYASGNKNLKTLPDTICSLTSLTELSVYDSRSLEHLPEKIGGLKSLKKLILNENINLAILPDDIGDLKNLTDLDVHNSINIKHLPESIGNLSSLNYVNLRGTGIESVPQSISSVETFFDSKRLVIIPMEESISYPGFVNSYYRLAETVFRFSNKARREGLLALEDDLDTLEDGLFHTGIRLVVDGTDCEVVRRLLTISMEREFDYYRKKLMGIAIEGILGIQSGEHRPNQLLFRLNLMVDIKDNPIDAAYDKYLSGDRDAFENIDFSAAIQPEGEREEIRFIKRAFKMSKKARREGLLALESEIDLDAAASGDVFEYGLSLILEGCDLYVWMGLGIKYIDAVLGKLVERENDPVRKNIAAAKKFAILSIYAGDNPMMLLLELCAYFDKSFTSAVYKEFLED